MSQNGMNQDHECSKQLVQEVLIQAPVGKVFAAWRDSKTLSSWFAPEANAVLKEGGTFEFFWDPINHEVNSTIGCRLLRLKWEEQIRFSWKGPEQFDALMNHRQLTVVTFEFIPDDNKSTLVRLIHSGWGRGSDWEEAFEWHVYAWKMILESLRQWVEKGAIAKPYWLE